MSAPGIDVSRYQGWPGNPNGSTPGPDWQAIADDGILWAAMRCTVGDYYVDPMFEYNYDGARSVGVLPFPYHVLRTDKGDEAQANWYIKHLGGRKIWMAPMDVEVVASGNRGRILHYTMAVIEAKTHAMTTIYTNANFWNTYMPDKFIRDFKDVVLWVASYGNNSGARPPTPPYPRLPNLWDDYGLWQYTSRGKVKGIVGWVDRNDMKNDTYTNLRARSGIPEPDGTIPDPVPPGPTPEPPVPDPDPPTEPLPPGVYGFQGSVTIS